jgi:hypothetical protein
LLKAGSSPGICQTRTSVHSGGGSPLKRSVHARPIWQWLAKEPGRFNRPLNTRSVPGDRSRRGRVWSSPLFVLGGTNPTFDRERLDRLLRKRAIQSPTSVFLTVISSVTMRRRARGCFRGVGAGRGFVPSNALRRWGFDRALTGEMLYFGWTPFWLDTIGVKKVARAWVATRAALAGSRVACVSKANRSYSSRAVRLLARQ